MILTSDVEEHHLRAGDVGTVVERHRVPGIAGGHSVKFFDMIGNTVAVVTVPANALRLPTPTDRRPQHPRRGRDGNPGFGALISDRPMGSARVPARGDWAAADQKTASDVIRGQPRRKRNLSRHSPRI